MKIITNFLAAILLSSLSANLHAEIRVIVNDRSIVIEDKCKELKLGMSVGKAFEIMHYAQRKTKTTCEEGGGDVKFWNDEQFSKKQAPPSLSPYGPICKVNFDSREIIINVQFVNE